MEKFIIFNILNCIFVDFYLTPFFYNYLFTCTCVQWACHSLCAEARSLLLSFYCLGSGDWTQVVRSGGKCLYLLSNLNGPTPLTAQGSPFPHPASHRYPWNTPQYDRRSLVDATAETERPAALLCNTHLFTSVFYMRFLLGHDHHHKSADFENLWCFPNPKIIYVVNFPVTLLSVFSKIKAPKIPNHLWNKHVHNFAAEVLEPSHLVNIICVFGEDTAESAGVLALFELMPMHKQRCHLLYSTVTTASL